MKLRLLMLGLMMSLMMSPTGVAGRALKSVGASLNYINRFIEALPDLVEADIKLDRSGEPVTPWSKWLRGKNMVEVPYYLSGFTSRERSTIRSSLFSVSSGTCINFQELSLLEALRTRPHLFIYPGVGCWTYIGMKWSMSFQYVSLSRYGCLERPIIQHVLMHVLGFTHEHSRPDRDQHLIIYLANVDPRKRYYYNKYGSSNQVTEYDYNSIMHFDSRMYGRSSVQPVFSARNPSVRFGTSMEMSALDREKINKYYECDRT